MATTFKPQCKGGRQQEVLTPIWLLDLIRNEFLKDWFDPCPSPRPDGYDSLEPSVKWGQRNFINPPFDNIGPFVERAIEEYKQHQSQTVILAPARVNRRWFLQHVYGKFETVLIEGELVFENHTSSLYGGMFLILIGFPNSPRPRVIRRPIDVAREQFGNKANRHTVKQHNIPGRLDFI